MTPPESPNASDPRETHAARLERLIGDVLCRQPPLQAPASLEARVLARIAQHQSLSKWHAGFARWPLAIRVAVGLALLLIAKLTIDLVVWALSTGGPRPVAETVEHSVSWARSTATEFSTLLMLIQSLVHTIPTHWITLGLAFAAGMYLMLFALSATAYRTLFLNK